MKTFPPWLLRLCYSIFIFAGVVFAACASLIWARENIVGGYLTPKEVAGVYEYKNRDIAEKLAIHLDGTYLQELHVRDQTYNAKGDWWLNTGANVIFMGGLYMRYNYNQRMYLDPPELDVPASTQWDYTGVFEYDKVHARYDEVPAPESYSLRRPEGRRIDVIQAFDAMWEMFPMNILAFGFAFILFCILVSTETMVYFTLKWLWRSLRSRGVSPRHS
jgi:hypothetical protein